MLKPQPIRVNAAAVTLSVAASAVKVRGAGAAKKSGLGGVIAPLASAASSLIAAAPSVTALSALKVANPSVLKTLSKSALAKVEPMLHPLYHQVEVGAVKGVAGMLHVERATLSDDVNIRVAQLAKFLTHDAIGRDTQEGWYNGMGGGNMPNTEMVFTTPGSTKVNPLVKLTQPFGYERDMSTFAVKAADLGPGGTLTAKMLFPTSGHCGFDDCLLWAGRSGAPYNVSLNFDASRGSGKVSPTTSKSMAFDVAPNSHVKYATDNKIVTVSDVTIKGLTKGEHRLYTWPDPTGVGGAPEERTIIINVI